ncbi:MAG: SUMF1/EgtB/PvdO family nonheme iron enzyme [Pseudomonadota bacterium]
MALSAAVLSAACGSRDDQGDAGTDTQDDDLAVTDSGDAGTDATDTDIADADADADPDEDEDTDPDEETAPCPPDMLLVGEVCMDLYEAPNAEGALPLVMYTFVEAEAWCSGRAKRLCTDLEWLAACEGPDGLSYPYGEAPVPGRCNDEETWLVYSQPLLDAWPAGVSGPDVGSLDELLDAARAVSTAAGESADHVESLYQGEGSGANAGCVGPAGVYDLVGNMEEWTRRADGGEPSFHGNLKGRYWAESRTCQQSVTVHGDGFRFYEIGFRCCADAI